MKLARVVRWTSVVVLLSSFSAPTVVPSAEACVDLKQARSFRFEGLLIHEVFPGPPNYRDVRTGDRREPAYILRLGRPICVSGDDFIDAKQKIDRVQVFPEFTDQADHALWQELGRLVGKFVVVEGREPFGAHTGHHHAPLLLPITKITAASPPAPK